MPLALRNSIRVCGIALCIFALLALRADAAYPTEQVSVGDQVDGDFVVGPGKVELTVEQGTEKTAEILVTNRMGEPRVFELVIEDIRGSQNPEEAVVLLGDEVGPYSIRDYVEIPETRFELAHGERARIPVTINIPENVEPGGLYGTVLVTTTSLPREGQDASVGAQTGAVIISRVGTLFFVTVPGDVEREGRLVDFSTIPDKNFFSSGPVRFQVLFENTGSMHLAPYGHIRIKNAFGQEVAEIPADPWFALPGSLRYRELSWDREHLLGYYTAEISINRSYDDVVDTMSVSFFVVPWTVLLATFGVILAIVFIVRLLGRTFQIRRREP